MTIRLTALTDRLSLLSGFDRTHPKTGELLLIWNNHQDLDEVRRDRRTPYNVAVSRDEGKSWVKMKTLEDDPVGWNCYTAVDFVGDHVLLGHCATTAKRAVGWRQRR